MDSLTFRPGHAQLVSDSPVHPGRVVFEDEGPAGHFYVCDRTRGAGDRFAEESILDSMLIYNGAALEDRTRERLVSVQWSRSGMQAVLYLDGTAQAMADFAARESFCRSNFPNFLESKTDLWRKDSHAWNEEALRKFEADIYE